MVYDIGKWIAAELVTDQRQHKLSVRVFSWMPTHIELQRITITGAKFIVQIKHIVLVAVTLLVLVRKPHGQLVRHQHHLLTQTRPQSAILRKFRERRALGHKSRGGCRQPQRSAQRTGTARQRLRTTQHRGRFQIPHQRRQIPQRR